MFPEIPMTPAGSSCTRTVHTWSFQHDSPSASGGCSLRPVPEAFHPGTTEKREAHGPHDCNHAGQRIASKAMSQRLQQRPGPYALYTKEFEEATELEYGDVLSWSSKVKKKQDISRKLVTLNSVNGFGCLFILLCSLMYFLTYHDYTHNVNYALVLSDFILCLNTKHVGSEFHLATHGRHLLVSWFFLCSLTKCK